MEVKCIVVDDEPLARNGIEEFIEQTPFLENHGSFGSAINALEFLKANTVDLIFLDIQMPDMNGLELTQHLPYTSYIIFTTAHREFALEGFELNAVDYLLKPISYHRFLKAVKKVDINNIKNRGAVTDHIFVKTDGHIVRIQLDTIIYIETAKDYIYIHAKDNRYMTLVSLTQIEKELPKAMFIRVHRSYLVNIGHIEKLEGNLLYVGESKIQISRNLRTTVYDKIIKGNLIQRTKH